jgi:hypothetical protein
MLDRIRFRWRKIGLEGIELNSLWSLSSLWSRDRLRIMCDDRSGSQSRREDFAIFSLCSRDSRSTGSNRERKLRRRRRFPVTMEWWKYSVIVHDHSFGTSFD